MSVGFDVAQGSVTNHVVKRSGPFSQERSQLFANHVPDIAAMDPCIAAGSVDVVCRLLVLTVLGHTGAICITPVVVGEVAACLKGCRAFRANWITGLGGGGGRSHPENADRCCQSELPCLGG
jgi:hypothetical protein